MLMCLGGTRLETSHQNSYIEPPMQENIVCGVVGDVSVEVTLKL